jgi:hypothetical protein
MAVEIKAICDQCGQPADNGLFLRSAAGWATLRDAKELIARELYGRFRAVDPGIDWPAQPIAMARKMGLVGEDEPVAIGPKEGKRDFCSPACFLKAVNETVVAAWSIRAGRTVPKETFDVDQRKR